MKEKEARRALRKLAAKRGVPEKKITADIEEMIRVTLEDIHKQGDSVSIQKWAQIPCRGEIPTALELIGYLSEELEKFRT